jgi:arylsulfatase A
MAKTWMAFSLFFSFLVGAMARGESLDRPNILLILADDLGYGDLGCYGHEVIQTPNIDRLANEGIRFTDCYAAAANCSPSRAGLMTGRTPWRVGIHNWIPFTSPMHLRESEVSVATLLRDAGYDTGHFGKWHLNGMFNLPGQPQPDDHGFEYWFATQNNALPNHRNPYNFVRNDIPVGPLNGYAGQIVADDVVQWLESGRDKTKPFFAYVCFHEPHEPIASDPKYESLYSQFESPSQRAHHGNVTQLDASVGRVLKAIERLGLRDETFVFFTSDNGPAITGIHPHGSAGPLRDKKGYLYDGGIRVPGIVRWPGKIATGTVCSEPIIGTDVLPTCCELAGIQPPSDRRIDGASFVSALQGKSLNRKTPLYWQFYGAANEMKVAMRDGQWKILAQIDGYDLSRYPDITPKQIAGFRKGELSGFELYRIGNDIGESREMSRDAPEQFQALKDRLISMHREVRDESPSWPVWEWPRYEGQRIEWPAYRNRR